VSLTVYFLIVLFIIVIDQLTKFIAVEYLTKVDTIPLIEDVFHLTYVENRGAAFGILKDHRWVFMVVSSFVILLIVFVVIKYKSNLHAFMLTGLSFALGGGIGNMIDRTVCGFVVDFLDFTLIDFPVFNVADMFICVGVGFMLLDILLSKSDLSFLDGGKKEQRNNDEFESN